MANDAPGNALVLKLDPMNYIEKLPLFSGKTEELYTFLKLIDDITPLIIQYNQASQSILFNSIKSKFIGKAKEIIEINNHITSWDETKILLINNLGEQKSSLQIFDELRGIQFKTNPIDFYKNLMSILRRLNNKTKHECQILQMNERDINSRIENNITSALQIFKNKLPEPMHSVLYSRNPETLDAAMKILFEGNFAQYNLNNTNNPKINLPFERNYNKYQRNQDNTYNNFNRNRFNQPVSNQSRNFFQNRSQNFNIKRNNQSQNFNANRFYNNYQNEHFNQNRFNNNQSQNFNRNQFNNRVEPMDVDPSTVRHAYNISKQKPIENFPSQASENYHI